MPLTTVLLAFVGMAAMASNEAGLTFETLDQLRAHGATVHTSVAPAGGRSGRALAFSEGGIECPMGDHLSAGSGTVDLWCQMPEDWPPAEARTLFHVGDEPHVHVTLFFGAGQLRAVYKGGEEHYSAVSFMQSGSWQPGTWHRIQFSWQGDGDEVSFLLRVDDRVVGAKRGKRIERWPRRFFVGSRGRTRAPWRGLLEDVRISPAPITLAQEAPARRTIEIHADRKMGECYNFWSIANFTSQDMFARPDSREAISLRNPFMKYVNCVRLIGGRGDGKNRFFLGVNSRGEPRCDFRPMVRYLQGMLDWGYTPRIVLDNVPTAMSEPETMHTYGNTYPPKDYRLYHSYIRALVQAMVDEFGAEVVRRWRFRVMTEPDLFPGHWAGTKEEYLKLYDFAVDAVCKVIPDADIGPGNVLTPAGARWGLDIIDHAATGTNYCTGQTGTRLRFISCSWYGSVGEPVDSFETAVEAMRDRLHAYPQFRDLPVEVAEFAVLHDEYGRRLWNGDATEWAASWFASIADLVYRQGVAQVHQWATTAAGIPVPRTHVLTMLESMEGAELLNVEVEPVSPTGCGAVAGAKGDRVLVMVYNHRPPRSPKVAESVTLRIRDVRMQGAAQWTLSEQLVDQDHGGFMRQFYRDCEQAGVQPLPGAPMFGGSVGARFGRDGVRLLHRNFDRYVALAQPLQVRTDETVVVGDGELVLQLDMPGHSVRFLDVRPPGAGSSG